MQEIIHFGGSQQPPARRRRPGLRPSYHERRRRGQLAGHELKQRFYEISSPAGLKELDQFLRTGVSS